MYWYLLTYLLFYPQFELFIHLKCNLSSFLCSSRCITHASEWNLCWSRPSARPQPSRERVAPDERALESVSGFTQRKLTKQRCRSDTGGVRSKLKQYGALAYVCLSSLMFRNTTSSLFLFLNLHVTPSIM